MRLLETIRKDYEAQKRKCQDEQAKLARLEAEYFDAIDALAGVTWRGHTGGMAGA